MLQKTRILALSFAIFILVGAVAPTSANAAWPLGRILHLHPQSSQSRDGRISMRLFNNSDRFQDVSIGGRVYTVMPHTGRIITAPPGTDVFAATSTIYHRKGDLLFSMTKDRDENTFSLH